jgi:membrane protease YdiL (CAAX protease family)
MKTKQMLWSILALAYFLLRFFFYAWLDNFGVYASYAFEIVLVIIAGVLYGREFFSLLRPNRSHFFALVFLPLGFLVYKAASPLKIFIPFDFGSHETLLFLLLVAPILEELLFRFFLWVPLAKIHEKVAFFGTSLLFSYSHFQAYWFMPAEFRPFIYFQTIYTLVLGLACAHVLYRHRSLLGAILVHLCFNLGFYLGFCF